MGITVRMLPRKIREYARPVALKMMAGRGLTVFPDDVFLVSHPRSGNTWMRFLITNLVFSDEPTTFLNIERRMPEIHFHFDYTLRRNPRPRFFKSHECFDPRYKRVIYIVRDPRDVAASHYHFSIKQKRIPDGYPVALHAKKWMEPSWEPEYGNWGEHVKSWLATRRGEDSFHLVRYEDLQANTIQQMAKIATFLGLERSDEEISRAIELSSADRMRTIEKAQQKQWMQTRSSRLDKPFVRKAIVGDWRTTLPPESVEAIEAAWGPLMESLGYQLSARSSDAAPAASPAEPSAQVL